MIWPVKVPVLVPDAGLLVRGRAAMELVKSGAVNSEGEALDLLAAVCWPGERFTAHAVRGAEREISEEKADC